MNRRQTLTGAMALAAMSIIPMETLEKITEPEPKEDYFIIPSMNYISMDYRERQADDFNTYTIVYTVMEKWMTRDKKLVGLSIAEVGTEKYNEWMKDLMIKEPFIIPPHIQFGGCIVSSKVGDPLFKKKWEDRTIERIRRGELA